MSPETPGGPPPADDDAGVEEDAEAVEGSPAGERPIADEPGDDGEAGAPAGDREAGPPPATWAAREWLPKDDSKEREGEGSGFTDDIEEVERELGDSLEGDRTLDEEEEPAEEAEQAEAAEDEAVETEAAEDEAAKEIEAVEDEGAEEEEEGEEEEEEEEEEQDTPEPVTSGDTTEVETLAASDREEAQEAALAGVRARAAAQATKREAAVKPAAVTPPPATPAGAARAEAAVGEVGEPPARRGLWLRFLAASLVIVSSMAAATAVSVLVYFTDIARGLGGIEGVQSQLAQVEGGDPQTILILGSDKRANETSGRSDTTILLRVDPDKKAIALLSLPRDLKVNIPGLGVDKLNAAYAYGGPKLTLRVVRQLTGLNINHVVNINFLGFADAVNAIDCVYIDIDRRYFVPPEAGYAEIDVAAGYQRLCGLKALQYVRFRHDDNDLVRAARQQDFLREARQKVPPSKLLADRNELLKIFTDYTTSDIEDPGTVIEVLKTFIGARSAEVKEVHFQGDIGGPDSTYVTASQKEIRTAVEQFLGVEDTPGPRAGADEPPSGGRKDTRGRDRGKPKRKPEQPAGPPMIDSSGAGLEYARTLVATEDDRSLRFPVMYPTRLVPGSSLNDASRSFPIDGPGDDKYHGYKIVVLFQAGAFSQFYGVSGTDWKDPPILENPSETREIDGREYQLYYDGDRLRLVAWKTGKASYWVVNTLLQTLSEEQMLALAGSVKAP